MSDATTLTPAERLAYRASVVRKSVDNLTATPLVPPLADSTGHALGPLLVEYWRLLVEQWVTARDTPQQLSMTIIQVNQTLQAAWAQENAACHSATGSVETSRPSESGTQPTNG